MKKLHIEGSSKPISIQDDNRLGSLRDSHET